MEPCLFAGSKEMKKGEGASAKTKAFLALSPRDVNRTKRPALPTTQIFKISQLSLTSNRSSVDLFRDEWLRRMFTTQKSGRESRRSDNH
jgi:hypothetical protein